MSRPSECVTARTGNGCPGRVRNQAPGQVRQREKALDWNGLPDWRSPVQPQWVHPAAPLGLTCHRRMHIGGHRALTPTGARSWSSPARVEHRRPRLAHERPRRALQMLGKPLGHEIAHASLRPCHCLASGGCKSRRARRPIFRHHSVASVFFFAVLTISLPMPSVANDCRDWYRDHYFSTVSLPEVERCLETWIDARPRYTLIHPLILLSNDTKDFLEYPLLHKHLQKPLHQWTDSLIRPVGNMVIQHQPLTKQRVRSIFHRVRL